MICYVLNKIKNLFNATILIVIKFKLLIFILDLFEKHLRFFNTKGKKTLFKLYLVIYV